MRELVIIPTFNERENLEPLATAVLATAPSIDLLVVDDNSPDGTGALADDLAQRTARVHVLHRAGKQGLGTAYLAGFEFALNHDYDRIVEMDADFSHRPEDLPALLEESRRADLVIGSRYVPGGRTENWPIIRRLLSWGGSLYARTLLRLPIKDCTSGFKCFRREVIAALDFKEVQSSGFGFQVELNWLVHQAGFRIAETPIVFPNRAAGHSKMSLGITLEAVNLVRRLRTRAAPVRHVSDPYGEAWRAASNAPALKRGRTSR